MPAKERGMLKQKTLVIEGDGRDAGKTFQITEMPAMRAEGWATRAVLALRRSGNDFFDDDVVQGGVLALVGAGFQAMTAMPWADAQPLLDEMLTCAQIVPDPARPAVARPIIESDIEEIGTLLRLRSEIVELHVGFSIAAALSALGMAAKATGSRIPTSPNSSEQP